MSGITSDGDCTAPAPLAIEKSSFLHLLSVEHLSLVENRIQSCLGSDVKLLSQIPLYLLELGGKRIRPALALAVGRAFGTEVPPSQLIDISAGIEMIHMATLLHDDIIDNSKTRRHRESPYARYGTGATLLAGDFLFVRAFGLCAKLDPVIIENTEAACVALTEGELLESQPDAVRNLETCLEISRKKTAALFRLAALSGAHTSGCSSEEVSLLATFGECAGVAFQIVDDILDVTATDDLLGKPVGADLRERKPSVINGLWGRHSSALFAEVFASTTPLSERLIESAKAEMDELEVISEARELAQSYADRAERSLLRAASVSEVRDASIIEALVALVRYTLSRTN